jgi:hypothetical protein
MLARVAGIRPSPTTRVAIATVTKMLRGFYQYFGLHHCERKLNWVRQQVQRQWISALNRRGQRRRTNWTHLKDRPWSNCRLLKTYIPWFDECSL